MWIDVKSTSWKSRTVLILMHWSKSLIFPSNLSLQLSGFPLRAWWEELIIQYQKCLSLKIERSRKQPLFFTLSGFRCQNRKTWWFNLIFSIGVMLHRRCQICSYCEISVSIWRRSRIYSTVWRVRTSRMVTQGTQPQIRQRNNLVQVKFFRLWLEWKIWDLFFGEKWVAAGNSKPISLFCIPLA